VTCPARTHCASSLTTRSRCSPTPVSPTTCSSVTRWAAKSRSWSRRRPAGLRGLVLVGPGPARPAAEITPEYQEQLSHAYDSEESTAAARDHILTATPLPDEIKAQVLRDSRSSAAAARSEWPLRGIAEDVSEQTQMVDVPVLVVAGENDHVEPLKVLRENLIPYLSTARVKVIPSTGHLIPLEAPAELADAIAAFSPGA